jgi:predicted aspartyl protease
MNIGSRAVDFLLDSGASEIAIDETVAQQLGLAVYGVHSYAGSARRFSGGRVIIPEMRAGSLTMHDVVAITVPSVSVSSGKRRAVGLLGFDFIDALGLKIDYRHGVVGAVPAEAFVPPAAATVLEARLEGGSPQVDVRVNGALGERFVIDTGNSGTFLIFDYFARRYPSALVDRGGGDGRDKRFRGIGGSVQTAPYQLETIDLGGFQFHDFVGYRVLATSEFAINDDGLIGSDLLRYFDLYMDYAHSRLYLVPNELGRGLLGSS